MGIIYDAIKKQANQKTEKKDNNFIMFNDFLTLLSIYTEDTMKLCAEYLMSCEDFLNLDYYRTDIHKDKLVFEKCVTDEFIPSSIPLEPPPNKDFLSDYVESKMLDYLDDWNDFYWNVEDVLSLDCIKRIGLNHNIFNIVLKV